MKHDSAQCRLSEILVQGQDGVEQIFGLIESDPMISGLASDSRLVREGNLFFALDGVKFKGEDFIPQAIQMGAAAVVMGSQERGVAAGLKSMVCAEPRMVLASAAARFYPRQPATIVAVTGTNGKTSVANLCQQIWEGLGLKAASIGTLGVKRHSSDAPSSGLTTPDTISLHQILQELADEGYRHVAIEASSHGLDQYRLDGVKIKAAGFTNLTQDHLDYHATMEDYFKAKSRLFAELLDKDGCAIVNSDDHYSNLIMDISHGRGITVIDYGRRLASSSKQILVLQTLALSTGMSVTVRIEEIDYSIEVPFFAEFQLWNLLCAIGLVVSTGIEFKSIMDRKILSDLKNIPGRLERIKSIKSNKMVFLDYAHTPDGLNTVLKSLIDYRTISDHKGKIILVFGCGGDRDRTKRPIMGKIANSLADIAIVTDDNPRTESAEVIRSEILKAMIEPRNSHDLKVKIIEIGNRAMAIKEAITIADDHDIIVIAGKGHESGQTIGTRTVKFSDLEEINKWI
ncbi:MAG: UDP-N-acetylmuramoyl-L-alanyl-D-glutamate--2,6-diaminopimelate ligase [Candidatus Pacebacteria bacterium]|nr:UDP-N-acetylmuramoyl-L-alanyl-D-glutamate--2,6-diaminopimelate ligase [Candidatus Paceibacterota bacterium]